MKDISNVIKAAQTMTEFRRRDKYGKFLPGLKKRKKTDPAELTENGCVNLVTAMMSHVSKNIENPGRAVSISYDKNITNYLKNLIEWIGKDNLWITSWCEIYDFDEGRVKEALIDKIEIKLEKY